MREKYQRKEHILNSKYKAGDSHIWQGIHCGLQILKKGIRRRIGNGFGTSVWEPGWLQNWDLLIVWGVTSTIVIAIYELLILLVLTRDGTLTKCILISLWKSKINLCRSLLRGWPILRMVIHGSGREMVSFILNPPIFIFV